MWKSHRAELSSMAPVWNNLLTFSLLYKQPAHPAIPSTLHPQIQKKSQYIKYLCCDDVRTLHQWVNGIRIAKYGKQLYVNYQETMKRTEAAYDWSSLSTASIRSGSSSASIPVLTSSLDSELELEEESRPHLRDTTWVELARHSKPTGAGEGRLQRRRKG
ncbi:amyloid beta A4 precursor protein-binding family B member 1-interacting protein-like [Trematomus bernacchii]|uniref:amyloid beta A4 precursor protein-binding family B member 1-interacting protein-like n=1 Tax=Trematomus bernacchii TaxID=40690 RepID=UPI00146C9922|nr:amyloid beta A4 precursor protein-binding family B member 1-interacting protein-like [Trematomus bernacchii]XP_034007404.1 amyloid beta A4 precursor protein-binding family B member 1-interacting protein-like [Trematomus bernacchii]XP_034007405.1 amyloid beta A4 precursor protein-binding family B member 1-interacting protein-like [Trematomus bernacchii]XP_034007406.1 amyloid beta A4 precursor protein-binding family B member 1-interacting protein-like [Trematomus bernacchii]